MYKFNDNVCSAGDVDVERARYVLSINGMFSCGKIGMHYFTIAIRTSNMKSHFDGCKSSHASQQFQLLLSVDLLG